MARLLILAALLVLIATPARAQFGDLAFAHGDAGFFGGGSPNQVCQNDGTGTFACANSSTDSGANAGVAAFDLDGDGDTDLAFATSDPDVVGGGAPNRLCVQDGVATGSFTCSDVSLDAYYSFGVAAADLDGDGDADLAFANTFEDPSSVCLQDGAGGLAFTCTDLGRATDATDVAAADLDGDSDADLAFSTDGDRIDLVCLNDGVGALTCAELDAPREASVSVAAADLDGDGDADLAFAYADVASRVCLNSGAGAFACSDVGAGPAWGVAAFDLDRDGDADLALTGRPDNRVCLNDGSATFTCSGLGVATEGRVAAADLDGDGDGDFALGGGAGNSKVCLRDGTSGGTYACSDLPTEFVGAFGVVVGNFGVGTLGVRAATEPSDRDLALDVAPNPVHDRGTVVVTLRLPSHVTVAVYDVLGRRVALLYDGLLAGGTHPLAVDTARLSVGSYVVQLSAGGTVATRMLTVVR